MSQTRPSFPSLKSPLVNVCQATPSSQRVGERTDVCAGSVSEGRKEQAKLRTQDFTRSLIPSFLIYIVWTRALQSQAKCKGSHRCGNKGQPGSLHGGQPADEDRGGESPDDSK